MILRNRLLAGFAAAALAMGPANAQVIIGGGGGGSGAGSVTSVATGACLTGGPITNTGTISGTYLNRAVTTTSDTILSSDACKIVTYSNAAAIAVALPQATGSFASGFSFDVENKAAGLVTITPTTSTINGAATLAVAQNTGCTIWSDGTNWQVSACTALVTSGGSPAGSGTEVQYRNAGAFGAIAGSSWNGTTLTLPALASSALNMSGTSTSQLNLGTAGHIDSNGTDKIDFSSGNISYASGAGSHLFTGNFAAFGTNGVGLATTAPTATAASVIPNWGLSATTGLGSGAANCFDGIANATDITRVCTTGMAMQAGVFTLKGFTVATLPASPATGSEAYVTDANAACTYGGTATGGGSTVCKMFYNGAWKEN